MSAYRGAPRAVCASNPPRSSYFVYWPLLSANYWPHNIFFLLPSIPPPPYLPSLPRRVQEIVDPTKTLPNLLRVGAPCTECTIADVCGGRCVYANRTKFWGDEGFDVVRAFVLGSKGR